MINLKITSFSNKLIKAHLNLPLIEGRWDVAQVQHLLLLGNSLQSWFKRIKDFELKYREETNEESVMRSKSLALNRNYEGLIIFFLIFNKYIYKWI